MRHSIQAAFQCNSKHISLEINPTEWNGTYSRVFLLKSVTLIMFNLLETLSYFVKFEQFW